MDTSKRDCDAFVAAATATAAAAAADVDGNFFFIGFFR